MREKMRERSTMNAMRSGLVVLGALAFGYLSLQLGFRPFLEKAQRTLEIESQLDHSQSQSQQQQEQSFDFPDDSSSTVRD